MFEYMKGNIIDVDNDYIIFENNNMGYIIYVNNPSEYKDLKMVYLYHHVTELENKLYGFKTKQEKSLFIRLLSVKGLGCRMALNILSLGTIDEITSEINNENILYLKKAPKVGEKLARQIVLDLKGKLVNNKLKQDNSELVESLKYLGYKQSDIAYVCDKINLLNPIEEQIKEALKLLVK